jgi:hypothetical protein
MTQKQEFNKLRKDNTFTNDVSRTRLRKNRTIINKNKTKQLVIDVVTDENNINRRELVVLSNNDRIVLDVIGEGNLSFLDNTSYLMDAVITSLGDNSEEFIAMLYFSKGNLIVYENIEFKEIPNTDLNFITNEPYTISELHKWGRFVYLNHNFFILSPFQINSDDIKPLIYFTDRSSPFGYRDIGSNIGTGQYFASFNGFNGSGSNTPIPIDQQPVLFGLELNNIGNRLRLYQQLEGLDPTSSSIDSSKYDNTLITNVNGTKTYTKTLLETANFNNSCESFIYDKKVSLKYTFTADIEFNILYGDYNGVNGTTQNNYYINTNSPEMVFIQVPDTFFTFTGICNPDRKYKFWIYDGVKTFGNYIYGFNLNVPQNEFGYNIESKFITKCSKTINAYPFPYEWAGTYLEVAPNRPTQHANNYGLELPRNVNGFTPTCTPTTLLSQIQDEITLIKQYVNLNNPLPVSNIDNNTKYQYYTSIPSTIKTIRGNFAYGSSCTIGNLDLLPTYSNSGNTEGFGSYTLSGITNAEIYPNKKLITSSFFSFNSTNCGFSVTEPITIDSISNYQCIYNYNNTDRNSNLSVYKNQLEEVEDIEKPFTFNFGRQYANKPSNIFYNFTNNSIILSISTE